MKSVRARLLFALAVFTALLPLAGPPAFASPERLVPEHVRQRAHHEGRARVIVELRLPAGAHFPEAHLPDAAVAAQRRDIASTRAKVLARLRPTAHQVIRQYHTVPLLALEVGPDAVMELEASGFDIERVTEDTLNAPDLSVSGPLIEADKAWANGYDGTGTVIAILDTGVDRSHPFLSGKVVEEACYSSTVPGRSATLCPNGLDEQTGAGAGANCSIGGCGHGTHVAGIAAGNGAPAGQSFSGVAKGADLMAVQVFSRFDDPAECAGSAPCLMAWTSDLIAALERVYLLAGVHNFASINLSLGGELFSSPCNGEPHKAIIDNLRAVGIATVAAAGNDGSTNSILSPACISSAVSVSSTTKTDVVSSFSNVAPFLSLFAPGGAITSSVPGGGYAVLSGTSMATPHVSGAWAVLTQAAPSATVGDILAALQQTGLVLADTRSLGRPRIRVVQALARLVTGPVITAVNPASGSPGAALGVTVAGNNFQTGAAAGFGAGITVTSTAVSSPTQLVANVTIATTAALGPRDVTVTNPGGASATFTGGFTVAPPPPTLSLGYVGQARDRVGKGNAALSPDGALDGTFAVTVQPGSGPRTVTALELRTTNGVWDTSPATIYWVLGAAGGLDGALLNSSTGAVSFAVADGTTFYLFGSDTTGLFTVGSSFTLTASFADGSTATATTTLSTSLSVVGVTPSQGARGAALAVTVTGTNFQTGAVASFGAGTTVTSTTVSSSTQLVANVTIATAAALGSRDVTVTNPGGASATLLGGFTVVASPPPTLSLAYVGLARDRVGKGNTALSPDGALDGTFTVTVQPSSGARTVTALELRTTNGVWDTAPATFYWVLGAATGLDSTLLNTGTGTVSFAVADGTTFYLFGSDTNGLFTVGRGFTLTASFADGSTATATTTLGTSLSVVGVTPSQGARGAALAVTVTGSNFQTGAVASFGAGTTVTSTTVSSSTQLVANVTIATTAALGPRDVTVTNPGGASATLTGGFTVAPPPPTLSLAYVGLARDRVGKGNTALSPDGAFDGTFRVTVQPGSGPRTVTALELRTTSGVWDTIPATNYWALGAATGLDATLLNAGTGAVSFAVADGTTVYLFGSDTNGLFTVGRGFTLTASFADGSTATATTTVGQ